MGALRQRPFALLFAGLVVGCLVGMNVRGLLPSIPLHASATEGFDNFAIATGLIDDRVEGLYFLDYITGELKCAVLNPKNGKFNSFFSYNIAADFGAAAQDPQYLIVTGMVDMPRGRAAFQFGKSVIYVAEVTSGQVAAYAIPWNSSMQAAGKLQTGEFVPLDKKGFRTAFIRE